jgi:hypothetical protein
MGMSALAYNDLLDPELLSDQSVFDYDARELGITIP